MTLPGVSLAGEMWMAGRIRYLRGEDLEFDRAAISAVQGFGEQFRPSVLLVARVAVGGADFPEPPELNRDGLERL